MTPARPLVIVSTMVASIRSIQPDLVGKIGCTHFLVALASVAVTGHAILVEDLLAGCRVEARLGRQSRQRTDIIRDGDDLLGLQHAVRPKASIAPSCAFGSPDRAPNWMVCMICVERAAPQPVVVIEVRISLGAGRTCAMAWRAIVAEHRFAARARQRKQLWILLDIGERAAPSKSPHCRRECSRDWRDPTVTSARLV